ncbi:MAG: alpha/beta hydrolase [Candidatus Hydrogenedentota bacterium]
MTQADWVATPDGLHLYARKWLPLNTSDANVVLIHGYGDHSGRYEHFARILTGASLAVYTYDQRGFGRSDGRRAYIGRFDQLLDDLDVFIRHNASDFLQRPLFLLGQSLGGLVVTRYAQTRQVGLSGLILCSPLLAFPDDVPKILLSLGRYVAAIAPWLPVSEVNPKEFSHSPEVAQAAENDPLNYHGKVHARTGVEMQKAVAGAFRESARITVPFFMAHGSADRVVPISGSRRFFEASAVPDKTLRIYENGYHELWHDFDEETLAREICQWIHQRL